MRLFLMIFSRTDLRISLSKAKNCEETDFDVQKAVAPPKLAKKAEKQKMSQTIAKQIFGRRKVGCRESSGTCFDKV